MYKNIDVCRACGATDLTEILAFGDMPLSNGLLSETQLQEPEPRFPLTVVFCPECSLVQIREVVAPEILFLPTTRDFSSVSDAWLNHCRGNALELMETRHLGPSSLVLEIASNDGYLLKNYKENGIPVLGVDPAAGVAEVARKIGIPTRVEFFGRAVAESIAAEGLRADVIHANNVLAHVGDLRGVVDGIRIVLKDTGVAVIEAPYLRDLIDHCEFDTIYHEHMCYFSVTAVARLFERQGLVLTDVRRLPTHGGSLRMFVQRSGTPSAAVRRMLAEEEVIGVGRESYYQDFAARVRSIQTSLVSLLESLKAQGKRVAGYAVSAKGAILLQFCRRRRASRRLPRGPQPAQAREVHAGRPPADLSPGQAPRRAGARLSAAARLELQGRDRSTTAGVSGAWWTIHRADSVTARSLGAGRCWEAGVTDPGSCRGSSLT